MNNEYKKRIFNTKNELASIKKWIHTGKNVYDDNTRYLVEYSIMVACGTLEYVYKHMIYDCLASGTNEEATTFLAKMVVDNSSNPSTGNIEKVLESCSDCWKNKFISQIKENNIKSDVNSLVQLRNNFSHGLRNKSSASIETVCKYFSSGEKMITILARILERK